MRKVIVFAVLCLLEIPATAEWIPLFDGKTLNGWTVKARPADQDREFWKVANGAITCDSIGRKDHDYVWLMAAQEFADFELEAKVRGFAKSPGNSGIQVRSRYDESAFWLDGPQIDVHPPAPWRTGLIYDETRGTRRWIFPSLSDWRIEESDGVKGWKWHSNGWNTIRILCRATNISSWVNGVAAADLQGAGLLDDSNHRERAVGLKGHIALQLHAKDELLIEYRDIRVRRIGN